MHDLAGAYALDALDEAERKRFDRHLRSCDACADEVGRMRSVAASLASAAAQEPPPWLRGRVLAAVAQTRQLPPETAREPRRPWFPPITWPRLVTWPRLAVALTGVAAVVALVFAIALHNTSGQLAQARAQDRSIAAVLAAPDVRVVSARVSGGGTATVVVSAAKRALIVSTAGLPALAGNEVYQFWLIGASRTTSAGLDPAQGGPVLASGLLPGDRLGMTVEPAGGTRQPTTAPILVVPLT